MFIVVKIYYASVNILSSVMLLYVVWLVSILIALKLYFRQVYSRFRKYGVKHPTPVPLLGNMTKALLRMEHVTDTVGDVYFRNPKERFVGRYEFLNPILLIKDLELIKKILVKDFECFLDHRGFVEDDGDLFFGRNLFFLKGQEWKDMRSTLSPAFTSSKIRNMVPFMVEVGDQMIKSLKNKINNSELGYIDIEGKDLSSRYANDVIATCAFGLKVDSHTDEDNEFYKRGKLAITFKFRQILLFFLLITFPRLVKIFKLSLFDVATKNFFKSLVLDTMRDRDLKKIVRLDMIHLLMEAKKGKLTHDDKSTVDADAGFATVEESAVGKKSVNRVWSDNDLIAQAVLFFLAGFETISTVMAFMLHELAVNPDVQEKLAKEIQEHWKKSGGKLDYTSIQNMTYMDMVVSEVIRLWPPVVFMDRQCTKDYNIGKPNNEATKDYIVRKGEIVAIPSWTIHRDPEYFKNPSKFDPERFSEENRCNINQLAYMPFGMGPRNCIGSRFALCEVKIMAYQILLDMEISPCDKTCIPVQLANDNFNPRIKGGHWVRMTPRK